jgi:hypothetical protein
VRTLVWRGLDEPRMEIAFDDKGFVTLYEGLAERVG